MSRASTFIVLAVSFLVLAATTLTPAQSADYQLDPDHKSILFEVKHMDFGYLGGMFLEWDASAAYDPENPEATQLSVTIQTESVFTNQRRRDNHLKSSDFFNASEFPEITFESTEVTVPEQDDSKADLLITGDLTMRGTTRTETLPLQFTGKGKNSDGNYIRGFYANFTLNRMDYNVDFMPDGISKEINVRLMGEMIRQ